MFVDVAGFVDVGNIVPVLTPDCCWLTLWTIAFAFCVEGANGSDVPALGCVF